LLSLVHARVRSPLAGYTDVHELDGDLSEYIVSPVLGGRAGVLGSLELARGSV
jgi:hypothetical protein